MVLTHSLTGGSVTLASTDPFTFPTINPGLLDSDFDKFTMREAVKAAKRFVTAPAWSDYVIGPAPGQFANTDTDDEIDAWVRDTTTTIWHPVGTASMAACNATGVVDPDLRVKGVAGVRVVDASVMVCTNLHDFERRVDCFFIAFRAFGTHSSPCLLLR